VNNPKTVACRDGDHAANGQGCQSRVVVRSINGWTAVPCTCFCHAVSEVASEGVSEKGA
jgi:hypothetical protein